MKILRLSLATILTAGALFAGTYNVDTAHSNVGFKVKHMMISNVSGKFNTFSGVIDFDEKTNTLKAINGTIDVSSINTENEKRDAHLKSADFFNAAKNPKITFTLLKVDGDTAYGKLTINNITKEVEFDLENNGLATDPWGNQRVGIELTGKIDRKDFGLTWNKALEAGGVLVGETVKLDVALEGILVK
ncbi:MAG: YceI family protein [Candidatus Marinarcus sp.]|uniref:YceI family protein n=1 Tax=Candidatus Marinarcus sp. TaxID=3100987 RepID=UPI003B003312